MPGSPPENPETISDAMLKALGGPSENSLSDWVIHEYMRRAGVEIARIANLGLTETEKIE